jgi:ParB-like chromosome segregation protein Spo0J
MREAKIDRMHLTDVFVPDGRRPVNPKVVERLKESITKIGLMTPITVKIVDNYMDPVEGEIEKASVLVAGRHRLEAVRALGHKEIDCFVWEDETSARMWELAENLHRAELTVQQRAEHIAEWIKLSDGEVSGQVVQKPQGGRPEGGISAASRELGIERKEAERAVKIASIVPEAKQAAKEAGLDDNQSKLLQVAAAPKPQQVALVQELAERRTSGIDRDVKDRAAQSNARKIIERFGAEETAVLLRLLQENPHKTIKYLELEINRLGESGGVE